MKLIELTNQDENLMQSYTRPLIILFIVFLPVVFNHSLIKQFGVFFTVKKKQITIMSSVVKKFAVL